MGEVAFNTEVDGIQLLYKLHGINYAVKVILPARKRWWQTKSVIGFVTMKVVATRPDRVISRPWP